jgi:hypothetical protein
MIQYSICDVIVESLMTFRQVKPKSSIIVRVLGNSVLNPERSHNSLAVALTG